MKLFVTGGTGFVGSHFINVAHEAGHEVLALRRSAASVSRIALEREPSWLECGMGEVCSGQLAGCDALVHLAAHTPNVPYDTLENCLLWNVIVPLGLFRKAVAVGIERFVVAGSCFEYGRSGERYEYIPPDAPLEPTQTYPASKAAASVAFYQFATENNLRFSLHRIFQVFGEGEASTRLWPSLRAAAVLGQDFSMTPSEQIRDFIPVEDVAQQLLVACLRQDVEAGMPVVENLGTGVPTTLRRFAEYWWDIWEAKGRLAFGDKPYRDGEVMRYVPLISR